MGISKLGYFFGEIVILKEEYLCWFKEIGKMNVNLICVYIIYFFVFYEVFVEYN